jgi:hypothetical protein
MRSSPCNINEILQALQSSETIRSVKCYSHLDLSISVVDEWIQLIKTLMSIEGIQRLELNCVNGCCDFHPLQAIADAVNNAHSLQSLSVLPLDWRHLDQSGIAALANALREHTVFLSFHLEWFLVSAAAQSDTSLDPVLLQALLACPQLRKVTIITRCTSADAVQNLLHSPTVTTLHLGLKLDRWLAVANGKRDSMGRL